MPPPRPPSPRRTAGGFTFLEVLVALSMLLVGSVAILSLFAVGTRNLVERKIEARIEQVRREAVAVLQDALDRSSAGGLPERLADQTLSLPEFTLDAEFRPSPFGGDRAVALAVIRFRGTPVWALPLPLTRSTLDPQAP